MKKAYVTPELEVELFDKVIMRPGLGDLSGPPPEDPGIGS